MRGSENDQNYLYTCWKLVKTMKRNLKYSLRPSHLIITFHLELTQFSEQTMIFPNSWPWLSCFNIPSLSPCFLLGQLITSQTTHFCNSSEIFVCCLFFYFILFWHWTTGWISFPLVYWLHPTLWLMACLKDSLQLIILQFCDDVPFSWHAVDS